MNLKRKIIPCPFCKDKNSDPMSGIWPFCSERCKLSDIGEWTSEGYTIAGRASNTESDEQENS